MNANVCEISLGDDKNVLKLIVVIVVQICMLSCFSYVQLFMTLWTIARQAPLSMGFSRQEY